MITRLSCILNYSLRIHHILVIIREKLFLNKIGMDYFSQEYYCALTHGRIVACRIHIQSSIYRKPTRGNHKGIKRDFFCIMNMLFLWRLSSLVRCWIYLMHCSWIAWMSQGPSKRFSPMFGVWFPSKTTSGVGSSSFGPFVPLFCDIRIYRPYYICQFISFNLFLVQGISLRSLKLLFAPLHEGFVT